MLPHGTYYVGDLCYVLKDSWNEVCDLVIAGHNCLDGEFKLPDGRLFAMYSTAYGDGCYNDEDGFEYCVDAGSIGCVRIEDCDVSLEKIQEEHLGHVHTFEHMFHTYAANGKIHIHNVVIDTDPPYEEPDVDEAQEWEDYDPDC